MFVKVLVVLLLVAAVMSSPAQLPGYQEAPETPANYEFQYGVKDDPTENDFGHQETRDGDFIQGTYFVQLPDGRLQKVTYTVTGDSGYVAEVTYIGEARYPDAQPNYA